MTVLRVCHSVCPVLLWRSPCWLSLFNLTLNPTRRVAPGLRAQSAMSPPPSSPLLASWLRQLRTSTVSWNRETRSYAKVWPLTSLKSVTAIVIHQRFSKCLDMSAQVKPRGQTWICPRCLWGRVQICVQRRRGSWGKQENSWAHLRLSQSQNLKW